MKNTISSNYKFCLIGKIKGLAEEVKRARVRLRKGRSEMYKQNVAMTKRFIGSEARHHLLAYAFMKHVPYALVEQKCAEDNKPHPDCILDIVHCHMFPFQKKQWTIDMVTAWLKGEEILEHKMSIREKVDAIFATAV